MANRFGTRTRRGRGKLLGRLLSVAVFCAIIVMFNFGITNLTQVSEEEALSAARYAVTRATVKFYAIEGHFPPNIDVLIEHYGLHVDLDQFIVHFDPIGANIMPQIAVFPR